MKIPQTIRRAVLADMHKKATAARWGNISKAERSAIMRAVRSFGKRKEPDHENVQR